MGGLPVVDGCVVAAERVHVEENGVPSQVDPEAALVGLVDDLVQRGGDVVEQVEA